MASDPQTQLSPESCPVCGEDRYPGNTCQGCHGVRQVCEGCSRFFVQPMPKAGDALSGSCRGCRRSAA